LAPARTQERLTVTAADVMELAKHLGLLPRQLLRPLHADEAECRAFYRRSARHRVHVWRRARACWQTAGISARLAATIMQVRYGNLSQALDDRPRGRVLAHAPARKLTSALNMPAGPKALLMFAGEMLPPQHKIAEVVTPLTDEQIAVLKALHLRAHSRALMCVSDRIFGAESRWYHRGTKVPEPPLTGPN
jgi:hypothetical protein